ncbi:MAG: response regulator, partial [Deinococcus sp.]|nr:response regulator [Deinococcus sp.]
MTQPEERVLRLLHLEDNDLDHELVTESLRADLPWQLEVRRAEDEPGFLHELTTFSPHLILSDYALPSYDGLRAFRAAQQHDPLLPFLIVTGAMGEEIAVDTLRQGVTDYILKQRLERLAPSVRRAIAEYDTQRR